MLPKSLSISTPKEVASTSQLKRSRKFRLRTVLVVPFIIPIIASTGLVGWLSFRNGQ